MSDIGPIERRTQDRVIALFRDELKYEYLGNWENSPSNSNIEVKLLVDYLKSAGYPDDLISRVLDRLRRESNNPTRSLYANNQAIWNLLYYGIDLKSSAGQVSEKVWLVDWNNPENNHFGIAEEVTLVGDKDRRPDIVLYLNGFAIGVLELKRSTVGIGEGIRQAISNQSKDFHEWFYSTVQFVMAGNDSEGLRYATIGTPEKHWLTWKEDEDDNSRYKLDKYLLKLFNKKRVLDIIRNFVVFDAGQKKLPRYHQYFGIKEAQKRVNDRSGGIIWHTQGSGKSIVMVLLAQWILETNPHARVLVITDRDELDKQIKEVFENSGHEMYRATGGSDLMYRLSQDAPRLFCSLVHKFGQRGVDNFEKFIEEIKNSPRKVKGELFIFVDEAHRTQSGKFNKMMKTVLPKAVFIGFTGTPLLKKDKQTTMEVFGSYIHTYKFKEAVEDEVVLDLMYEARDIDQHIGNQEKIDQWFEVKTQGLNDWKKLELKNKWISMKNLLSSASRIDRVVQDIVFDFSTKPRLLSSHGNAILVAGSIYEACRYFEAFQKTEFNGKCGLITSYDLNNQDLSLEDTGANTKTDREYIYRIYEKLLENVEASPNKTKTESYEDNMKAMFKSEPANMRLLIVVNKLLTGFDAPPCTYLYLDKNLQDHGLFQAICRTNRLDTEDKQFGYIVDYKDLFKKVKNAISVYSSELDHSEGDGGTTPEVLLKDRLEAGRERLDQALDSLFELCEPVPAPRNDLAFIQYFCGNTENPEDLKDKEPLRVTLYKLTVAMIRAFGNIADELKEAGYTDKQIEGIKSDSDRYLKLRDLIRNAAGEVLDTKPYEADMRFLLDSYVKSDEPRKISPFDDMSLLTIIEKLGIAEAIDSLPEGLRSNPEAVAEAIENNIRSKIVKEELSDPLFYQQISDLLLDIIKQRKTGAIDYENYLKEIADLVQKAVSGTIEPVPASIDTRGKLALFNNLGKDLELAMRLDLAIRQQCPDAWRKNPQKEKVVKRIIFEITQDESKVEPLFEIISNQLEY